MFLKKFPFREQLDSADCGFACIRMICKYYGINLSNDNMVFNESNLTKQGLSFPEILRVCDEIGFNGLFVNLNIDEIIGNVTLPAIFFWNDNHFIVVHKISNNKFFVNDPAIGSIVISKEKFIEGWIDNKNQKGIILLLQPTAKLFLNKKNEKDKKVNELKNILKYLLSYKKQLYFLGFILLASSSIEFLFPFFTQKIIDKSVISKNLPFLYIIIIAQITLFFSKIINEFYRSWLFIHISSRVSLQLVSDFLTKLMSLPIKFFSSKSTGDLLERINDHKRVESFLTNDLIKSVFAFFSLIVFSIILFNYNRNVFFVFIIGNSLQLLWIFIYLDKLKEIDKKKFRLLGNEQNKNIELLTGIQEIKLNNLENHKRLEWEKIQLDLFKNNINNLQITQKYESYRFISFFTSIIITFISAYSVINGSLTIGTMMAIVFVIGAVNVPISQIINFVLSFKLLLSRITRIEEINSLTEASNSKIKSKNIVNDDIIFQNINFSYDNKNDVLKNINLTIKKGTTTAIVGYSGSGKTTLIKLLLKFYNPKSGTILLGTQNIENFDETIWRNHCGVIFQDSFIFSNSIEFNIALKENVDIEKLNIAIEKANIKAFIEELPLKHKTVIGREGIGISQGQTQRILIARAIYKNPDYLFFDEATNSLDAENEKIIVDNIEKYFKGKTKIIIAHRLNTVINADQIVVLDNGIITEKGAHSELIKLKGKYFNLIKNQL